MQTTFPELASSMGKVIPLASALKVKQEELFGAMSTLTGVTGNTAEVSTQLRGVFQGFMKPTSEMSAALEKMGYKTGAAALESLGFEGALGELKKAVGGNETELVNMFGSVEAGTAVLALTGSQADKFTEKNKAMAEAAGATNEAFAIQQATVDAMMKKMSASFNVVMITLGEKLLPMFNSFLEWVIAKMPEIQNIIDVSMKVVGDAVTGLINIVKDYLIPAFQAFWDWIQPYIPMIKDAIKLNFEISKAILKGIADFVINYVVPMFMTMAKWFYDNFPAIKNAVMQAYNYIKPSFDNLVRVIRENLMPMLGQLWDTFKKAMPGIKSAVEIAFKIVLAVIKNVMDNVALFIEVVSAIYWQLKPTLDDIATLFSTVFGGIKKVIEGVQKVLNFFNNTKMKNKESTVNTKYTSSGSSSQYGGVNRGYASGTDYATKGLHWVGEEGPELLNFNGGETIKNAKDSAKIASGKNGGFNLNIETFVNERKQDVEELAEELSYYIKKKELGGA